MNRTTADREQLRAQLLEQDAQLSEDLDTLCPRRCPDAYEAALRRAVNVRQLLAQLITSPARERGR